MMDLFRRGTALIGALAAVAAIAPAAASAADSTSCPSQDLSQPFTSVGDFNQYMLMPGQMFDNVDGAGWKLEGGAKLVPTVLQDGSIGQVIDLPSKARAISPEICVDASNYPLARTLVQNVMNVQGVAVSVSYDSNGKWGKALNAGNIKSSVPGWDVSKPIMLHSATLTGIHLARLTLTAIGTPSQKGEYQVYNFYVDPRMHR